MIREYAISIVQLYSLIIHGKIQIPIALSVTKSLRLYSDVDFLLYDLMQQH